MKQIPEKNWTGYNAAPKWKDDLPSAETFYKSMGITLTQAFYDGWKMAKTILFKRRTKTEAVPKIPDSPLAVKTSTRLKTVFKKRCKRVNKRTGMTCENKNELINFGEMKRKIWIMGKCYKFTKQELKDKKHITTMIRMEKKKDRIKRDKKNK